MVTNHIQNANNTKFKIDFMENKKCRKRDSNPYIIADTRL